MGHIGQKGKQSMEKVIDKSRAYETYRLAWDDIAKLLSDQIKAVLGRRFLLRVWPEDQGYWGARALHGLFSVADLNRLLDAVQADAETRMETLPEDSEAVHGFGMTLGSLLLKAALQADWKCEMVEDDALWLIGFVSSETRPYTVSGLLRTLNPDTLMSAKEILAYLKDNDSTDRTLSDIILCRLRRKMATARRSISVLAALRRKSSQGTAGHVRMGKACRGRRSSSAAVRRIFFSLLTAVPERPTPKA